MNELEIEHSWRQLPQVRGVGLLLRGVILLAPLVALACTRAVTEHPLPVLDVMVVLLTIGCVVAPDSPLAVLVILLVAVEWGATVHDRTSLWSVAVAAALAVFHSSLAASTVAAPSARWTAAMCRRWLRRTAIVIATSALTWGALVAIDGYDVPSNALLVTAALVVVAVAALWLRDGALVDRDR